VDKAAERAMRNEMLEMISGCWSTQIAGVACRFKIPDLLAAGARTAAEIAAAIEAPADPARRLLRAMCALDLARQLDPHRFELTPRGALLRSEVPGSMSGLAQSWIGRQWTSWALLEQGVRTGKPTVGGFETVAADPEAAVVINQAQADRSRLPAAEIARTYDWSRFKRLLDVGGGYGTVLNTVLRAHSHMTGAVLDLAYHEDRARSAMAADGVADRADFIGGSFFESVPAGFDCYLMKSIIHDWADAESHTILSNTAKAAGQGGTVLIVDQVLPEIADSDPANHSAFRTDITMLLGTGGCERTEAEFTALLKGAGLTLQRIVANDSEFRVIEATVD